MTGLKLQFNGFRAWALDLTEPVTTFDATVQCCLVNMGVPRDAQRFTTDAGTDLFRQGVMGLLSDLQMTRHQLNFAAAETMELINGATPEGEENIDVLQMQVSLFNPPDLHINIFAVSSLGEQRGTSLTNV